MDNIDEWQKSRIPRADLHCPARRAPPPLARRTRPISERHGGLKMGATVSSLSLGGVHVRPHGPQGLRQGPWRWQRGSLRRSRPERRMPVEWSVSCTGAEGDVHPRPAFRRGCTYLPMLPVFLLLFLLLLPFYRCRRCRHLPGGSAPRHFPFSTVLAGLYRLRDPWMDSC